MYTSPHLKCDCGLLHSDMSEHTNRSATDVLHNKRPGLGFVDLNSKKELSSIGKEVEILWIH